MLALAHDRQRVLACGFFWCAVCCLRWRSRRGLYAGEAAEEGVGGRGFDVDFDDRANVGRRRVEEDDRVVGRAADELVAFVGGDFGAAILLGGLCGEVEVGGAR